MESGVKFGLLTTVREINREQFNGKTEITWLCACACGKKIRVKEKSLRPNGATSCGCKALAHRARMKKMFCAEYSANAEKRDFNDAGSPFNE